jgi:hypothetical protein
VALLEVQQQGGVVGVVVESGYCMRRGGRRAVDGGALEVVFVQLHLALALLVRLDEIIQLVDLLGEVGVAALELGLLRALADALEVCRDFAS